MSEETENIEQTTPEPTEEKKDKDTLAIHQYNQKLSADVRVKNFILSLRDGLNIAQKIS